MQAGVGDEVVAGGGGDGGHVADVLHHRGDGDGRHDEDGGDVELRDGDGLEADDACLMHGGEIHLTGDEGDNVADHDAEEDGDDLDHALAPDVGGDDDRDGDQREPPVGAGVADGAAREVEADHDDHGAGDDGREVAHDLPSAEHLKEQRQHEVQQARDHDAAEGVGELVVGRHGRVFAGVEVRDRGEAAEVSEGRAEEGGDLHLGADVEQQRAETRHQQRGLDAQRQAVALHEDGDEHRRAEHGEQMLQAEHQHAGHAELAGVIDSFLTEFLFHVFNSPSLEYLL